MRRLLAAAILLLSPSAWALNWEEIHLGVDENRFYFNIVVSGFSETTSIIELSLYTELGVIIIPDDQEHFLVEIDLTVNSILDGPLVEPIGEPESDRWLDGEVTDFKSFRIVEGTWQFIGSIANGENPYQPDDRLGEIRIVHPGGVFSWGSHPITAQPPPSLSVSKSSSTRLVTEEGQQVSYVYEIRNTGQVALWDVALTDDNVDAAPYCAFGAEDMLEVAPNPESSVICSARHTVTALELEEDGFLNNTATATADGAEPAFASLSIPIGIFSSSFERPENVIYVVDDTNVSGTNSIAVTGDGFPAIAYTDHDLDASLGTLKVAKCFNTTCTQTSINDVDQVSNAISNDMAVKKNGFPVISYIDYDPDTNTGVLKVASCNDVACAGGDEVISVVDDQENASFRKPSIAIGLDGAPVISYYDQNAGKLKVAKCNDADCSGNDESIATINDAADMTGWFSTIAVAPDGFPIISYEQIISPWDSVIKVAKCNDTNCAGEDETITSIANGGGIIDSSVTLAIGADGMPVLLFRAKNEQSIFVVKCNDAACSGGDETTTAVDTSLGLLNLTSLAVGFDGFPVMTYRRDKALRVVKCTDVSCSNGDVIANIVDDLHSPGYHNSITVGSDGMPVISYTDSAQSLKVVHCGTESCQ